MDICPLSIRWSNHFSLQDAIIQRSLAGSYNATSLTILIRFSLMEWVRSIYDNDDLSKWGLTSGQSVTELEASVISIMHLLCKIIHMFVSFIDVHCLRPGHSRSCPAWFELHAAIGNWSKHFSVLISCTSSSGRSARLSQHQSGVGA